MSSKLIVPPPDALAAYILGGGASRRMGASKVGLSHEGRTLLARLRERLTPHVREVWVVLKESQRGEVSELPSLFDAQEEHAVVHGVRAVLTAQGPPWRLILACDMPDVDASVIASLWQAAQESGAPGACLQRAGRAEPEPFPSLWHVEVAQRITAAWGMKARDWLRHANLAVYGLPAARDDELANLNTPAQWKSWRDTRTPGVGR